MFGWLWTLFFKLGFWKKNGTLVVVGLDNAGKTTLMYRHLNVSILISLLNFLLDHDRYKLKHGSVSSFFPTQRAREEEVVCIRSNLDQLIQLNKR